MKSRLLLGGLLFVVGCGAQTPLPTKPVAQLDPPGGPTEPSATETGAPPRVLVPAPGAAAPVPAAGAITTNAATTCATDEYVVAGTREDVAWAKRVTDAMAKGLPRKKLVCMFGTAAKPNGDFLEVTPHHRTSFSKAVALAKPTDHPEESIEVTFAAEQTPLVGSVEKALGKSKPIPKAQAEGAHKRMIHVALGKDVSKDVGKDLSIRAILTLADDGKRVSALHIDVSDLRGWTAPPPSSCADGANVKVYPPSGDRFPKGHWTFDASDAAGAKLGSFACDVPEDILDVGKCTPTGEKAPGAEIGSMASSFHLHLPGQPTQIDLAVTLDGKAIGKESLRPRFTKAGTCSAANDVVTLSSR